jgi:PadR family transcriptional regulator, regulatory protein PadR
MILRMTLTTRLVLRALAEPAGDEKYGRQIARQTGLRTGTVGVILRRLEASAVATSRRGDPGAGHTKGPVRIYYKLTAGGEDVARAVAHGSAAGRPAKGVDLVLVKAGELRSAAAGGLPARPAVPLAEENPS